jgi:hypothetical protein
VTQDTLRPSPLMVGILRAWPRLHRVEQPRDLAYLAIAVIAGIPNRYLDPRPRARRQA